VITEAQAASIAAAHADTVGRSLVPEGRELERGWYFQWAADGCVGSHGMAVSKETGRVFVFGSAFPVERDLRLYDRGMDADRYDLVVLGIRDLDRCLDLLQQLEPQVVELSYDAGTVWRLPRKLTRAELRHKLDALPAIFPDLTLYFRFEAIEDARESGCCEFDLLPRGQ
jgi:hypothetical protein